MALRTPRLPLPTRPGRLGPWLAGLLVLASAGCRDGGSARRPHVLIVSVDTLRADRLGVYGNAEWGDTPTPVSDALAARGVVFEQAYAPRGETHPSLAAMLTGKYPITTGVRENSFPLTREHATILERLAANGYRTGAFVANFEITHADDAWVARGAEVAADGFGGRRRKEASDEANFQEIWDDRVEQAALAFLDEVDPTRPFALWVHFYDVHKPFNPPAREFDRYGRVDALPGSLQRLDASFGAELERHLFDVTLGDRPVADDELQRIRGLYDATVAATDERLGRLVDRLQARGLLESTYVVFTSDHGEELFDRNRYFFHGSSIYQGVVRIPLVVAGPDVVPGRRVGAHVQNIDLAPTLLDLLGLPPAADVEGRSLAPLLRGETDAPPAPFAFIEWQDLIYAVTDGRYKLIFNPQHVHPRHSPYGFPGVPAELGFRIDCIEGYDLRADPGEQVNLLAGFDLADLRGGRGLPPEFRPLFEALTRWLADPQHQRQMRPEGLGPAQVERMRQLGYIGTGMRSDSVRQEPCVPP